MKETRTWIKQHANKIQIKNEQDYIKTDYKVIHEYEEDGTERIRRVPIKRNITKEVNETAKLLKALTLNEKAEQLKEIINNE